MNENTVTKSVRNSDTISASIELGTYIPNLPRSSSLPVSLDFHLWFLDYFKLSEPDGSVSEPNAGLLRFAAYLLSADHRWDKDYDGDDEVLIPADWPRVREIFKPGCKDKNFNAEQAIQSFSKRIWKITTREPDHFLHQCRCVVDQKLPPQLVLKLRQELTSPSSGGYVDLVTGFPFEVVAPDLAPSVETTIEGLRIHLNELDRSKFACIQGRIVEARELVSKQEWSVKKMQRELVILRKMEVDAKPLYRAVPGTKRLYAGSWLNLKRKVRDEVTKDLWKFDLKAAQLHISAAIWDWDIEPYKREGSVWTYMLHSLGSSKNNQACKDELKTLVYASLFGANQKTLRDRAQHVGGSNTLKGPLMKDILQARQKTIAVLKRGDELEDAWGQKFKVNAAGPREEAKQVRSIMGATCQSYELRLLIPLIDLAKKKGLTTVAILHDCIYGEGDWEPILDELKAELKRVSLEVLGKEIELEITPPKAYSSLKLAA